MIALLVVLIFGGERPVKDHAVVARKISPQAEDDLRVRRVIHQRRLAKNEGGVLQQFLVAGHFLNKECVVRNPRQRRDTDPAVSGQLTRFPRMVVAGFAQKNRHAGLRERRGRSKRHPAQKQQDCTEP